MRIRKYAARDCASVARLFYETVHAVNARDYTAEQLFAWASSPDSLQARRADLSNQATWVAVLGKQIVGFVSIDADGYLDFLFVHKDFQRHGIATALCEVAERGYAVIKTDASVTAKPFFAKRGYKTIASQTVRRNGIELCNYAMEKRQGKDAMPQS